MDTKENGFFTDDHLYLYWPGSLGEVRASVVDTIVNISNSHYIYFESIHFRGSNFYGVKIREGNYNKFNLCKFSGIGEIGIYVYGRWEAYPSPGASEGNEITNCEFSDIQLCSIFYRYSRGGKITNNYIHRNAMDNAYHNLKQRL
jgi:parallel beta-helix repeat protein